MPAASGASQAAGEFLQKLLPVGVVGFAAQMAGPTIASSCTCRERGRPAGRWGAAARSAALSSRSSVTWMRGLSVGIGVSVPPEYHPACGAPVKAAVEQRRAVQLAEGACLASIDLI